MSTIPDSLLTHWVVGQEETPSLVHTHPELVSEWYYVANTISPSEVNWRSTQKVYWACKSGACGCHIWEATIVSRVRGNGCPYCAPFGRYKRVCVHSSLEATHPWLLDEWDYTKNKILPSQVSYGCKKLVSWVCKNAVCGCHVWKSTINNRSSGTGCPYCAGSKICIHTSLASTHPDLMKDWDYSRHAVNPKKITAKYKAEVHWACRACGYKWKDTVRGRINGGGCKQCAMACVPEEESVCSTSDWLYSIPEDSNYTIPQGW